MKRLLLYLTALTLCVAILSSFVVFENDVNQQNIEFLSSFGWIVSSNPIERERFLLPTEPDDVMLKYNLLQKEAGLDLSNHWGKICTRYTYQVQNYPYFVKEPVRANLLLTDGIIIAGDIMTVSIDGFMHSLNFPLNQDIL